MIPRASAIKADQTMDHLLEVPLLQQTCCLSDLIQRYSEGLHQTIDQIGVVTDKKKLDIIQNTLSFTLGLTTFLFKRNSC